MAFDLRALISDHVGNARSLHEDYGNAVFARVLELIGFEHEYVSGEGAWLQTLDGRRVYDALSGYGVFGMGRNHPAMLDAMRQIMESNPPNLPQMDCSLLSGLLAKRLIGIAPGKRLQRVFFTNSGTEAVEGAMKFARAATGRPRILFCKGAYHGLSMGALSINGDDSFREGFGDLLPGCEKTDLYDLDLVKRELGRGDVAAVVFEPLRGKGVIHPQDDSVYPELQRLCRERETLFVADEIQCGLGRTGRWWACEHWGLEPDILVSSKALSGGIVPVGAILYSDEIYRKVFSRLDRCVVHSSTFGQNSYAMAAGLAAIEIIESEGLVERSAALGERLLPGLRRIAGQHEFVKEVRGKGLMAAVEFGSPRSLRLKPAWALLHAAENGLFAQAAVMQLYKDHSILSQVAGHHQEVIKFMPPFISTEAEIDVLVDALDAVLHECRRFPGPVWSVGKQLAGAAARQKLHARAAGRA